MKKYLLVFSIVITSSAVRAQAFQLEQLALDLEKLAQLKNILSDLYKGYQILSEGYTSIRDISEGNFSLHQAFLDRLLIVSPAVKNYCRVTDIIRDQASLVSEYRSAFNLFNRDRHFSPGEITYVGQVYKNLFNQSLEDITNLLNILTSGSLRMSDDERLRAIDDIFNQSRDKLTFLRQFNSQTRILGLQRSLEEGDVGTLLSLYGSGPPR
jgi:hypothetical protein